jgi:hypothetical protein
VYLIRRKARREALGDRTGGATRVVTMHTYVYVAVSSSISSPRPILHPLVQALRPVAVHMPCCARLRRAGICLSSSVQHLQIYQINLF